MLKTISAALIAVSMLAAPALAGPGYGFAPDRAGHRHAHSHGYDANARMMHRDHRAHRHHNHRHLRPHVHFHGKFGPHGNHRHY